MVESYENVNWSYRDDKNYKHVRYILPESFEYDDKTKIKKNIKNLTVGSYVPKIYKVQDAR